MLQQDTIIVRVGCNELPPAQQAMFVFESPKLTGYAGVTPGCLLLKSYFQQQQQPQHLTTAANAAIYNPHAKAFSVSCALDDDGCLRLWLTLLVAPSALHQLARGDLVATAELHT